MTQKEIFLFLKNNPLKVDVHMGDLEDLQGKDYIFLDFLGEEIIGSDNNGIYKTNLQITIATRQFEDRRRLVEYCKGLKVFKISYETSSQFQYYLARLNTEIILNEH